jgi:hypothetical protein
MTPGAPPSDSPLAPGPARACTPADSHCSRLRTPGSHARRLPRCRLVTPGWESEASWWTSTWSAYPQVRIFLNLLESFLNRQAPGVRRRAGPVACTRHGREMRFPKAWLATLQPMGRFIDTSPFSPEWESKGGQALAPRASAPWHERCAYSRPVGVSRDSCLPSHALWLPPRSRLAEPTPHGPPTGSQKVCAAAAVSTGSQWACPKPGSAGVAGARGRASRSQRHVAVAEAAKRAGQPLSGRVPSATGWREGTLRLVARRVDR